MNQSEQVNLSVLLPKNTIMMPAWSVHLLIVCFILSSVACILSVIAFININKEIRILQLHVIDVQNVLIREGKAKRGEDFANWYNVDPETKKEK